MRKKGWKFDPIVSGTYITKKHSWKFWHNSWRTYIPSFWLKLKNPSWHSSHFKPVTPELPCLHWHWPVSVSHSDFVWGREPEELHPQLWQPPPGSSWVKYPGKQKQRIILMQLKPFWAIFNWKIIFVLKMNRNDLGSGS